MLEINVCELLNYCFWFGAITRGVIEVISKLVQSILFVVFVFMIFGCDPNDSTTQEDTSQQEESNVILDLNTFNFSSYYRFNYTYRQEQVGSTIMWATYYDVTITPANNSFICENCRVVILGNNYGLNKSGTTRLSISETNLEIGGRRPQVTALRVSHANGSLIVTND